MKLIEDDDDCSDWREQALAVFGDRQRPKDDAYFLERVAAINNMHRAGAINDDQRVFMVMFSIEWVVGGRIRQGASPALERISRDLKRCRKDHGLTDDEYFLKGHGPHDVQALDAEYDTVDQALHAAALDEFGASDIAALFCGNYEQCSDMRERGRLWFFEKRTRH